jgi:hypothetical protein
MSRHGELPEHLIARAIEAGITGRAWRVLAVLSLYADAKTGKAYPGLSALSEKTKIDCRDLPRVIGELVEAGLITRIRGTARPKGKPGNLYILSVTETTPTIGLEADGKQTDGREADGMEAGGTVGAEADLTYQATNIPSEANASSAPRDPVMNLWDRGLAILGRNQRSLLGKLRKQHGDVVVIEAICAAEAEQPSDPRAWLLRACEARSARVIPFRPGKRSGPYSEIEVGRRVAEQMVAEGWQ